LGTPLEGSEGMARITVVNDQREFLDIVEEVLMAGGHEIETMVEVQGTAESIAESRPDLLIVDLRLRPMEGRMTGWELVVLSRADPRLANVPIIVCSADREGAGRHAEEMEALGNVHLLLKPFALVELETLVSGLLLGTAASVPVGGDADASQPRLTA
jgi:CheY-like chemotaxis protein